MAEGSRDTAALLAAARAGSRDALGEILEACRGYLLVVAQGELDPHLRSKGGASDLVQETFFDAQRDFARFEGTSEEELLAWLRQVLLNKLANFTRQYRGTGKRDIAREVALPGSDTSDEVSGGVAADTPSPSVRVADKEKAEALHRALERLSEDYRRIITLRHDEDRSFEEIGRLMNRSPNAARKLWARAIERLQQELDARHEP
jgi:RNA polymerase sigma-70 factor (ECF subfamily)